MYTKEQLTDLESQLKNQTVGEAVAPSSFERELESLLNKYSWDNSTNTPDFILAEYVLACLQAYKEESEPGERDITLEEISNSHERFAQKVKRAAGAAMHKSVQHIPPARLIKP